MWVPVSAWQSCLVDPADLVEQAPPGQLTLIAPCWNNAAASATRRGGRSTTPGSGRQRVARHLCRLCALAVAFRTIQGRRCSRRLEEVASVDATATVPA